MGVTISDRNRIPEIIRELEYLANHRLEVGIFGDEVHGGLLMIARVHEFGVRIEVTPKMRAFLHHIGIHLRADTEHINIPERSYLRATFDQQQGDLGQVLEHLAGLVVKGSITGEAALGRAGAWFVGKIQATISAGIDPPLGEQTIKRKGSSTPLIDTGRLWQSITWRVVG